MRTQVLYHAGQVHIDVWCVGSAMCVCLIDARVSVRHKMSPANMTFWVRPRRRRCGLCMATVCMLL